MRLFLRKLKVRWARLPAWLRLPLYVAGAFAFIGLIAAALIWHHYINDAETYDLAALRHDEHETLIVDARGELVGSVGDVERELVTLPDVSPLLVKAVIATEDARFYSHSGYDVVGLSRAAVKNFTARGIKQGGSTITQQLARNVFGLEGRSYERKVKEIFLAMRIEDHYQKDEILTHYLNRIYLGHGFVGVGAAARGYFGKETSELSLAEAATLAGIIKAPVSFSPITRPDLAKEKRDLTLKRMADTGEITAAEAEAAINEAVVVKPDRTKVRTGYMLAAARSEFQAAKLQPGATPEMSMTLRLDWQRKLDIMMREHLAMLDAKDKHELQGAVLVLDNRTGAILAMQGGRDFVSSPFNRALDGRRPAGTAFLPVVYVAALTLNPASATKPLLDGPMDNRQAMIGGRSGTLGEWGGEGAKVDYSGAIKPLEALIEGRTAATVRLGYDVGLTKLHEWLQKSVFESPLRTEAAFTLGQSHVSPLELARAFTALATDGIMCPPPSVLRMQQAKGKPVFLLDAVSKVRSTMITGMTRPEYRASLAKHGLAGKAIAGFGGCAYNFTDAWFVGFDRDLTCLVWIGHDKDAPISDDATAATSALPLWVDVYNMVTDGNPKTWGARSDTDEVVVLPPRATLVDEEVKVLAIQPTSKVVLGKDDYQASTQPQKP